MSACTRCSNDAIVEIKTLIDEKTETLCLACADKALTEQDADNTQRIRMVTHEILMLEDRIAEYQREREDKLTLLEKLRAAGARAVVAPVAVEGVEP